MIVTGGVSSDRHRWSVLPKEGAGWEEGGGGGGGLSEMSTARQQQAAAPATVRAAVCQHRAGAGSACVRECTFVWVCTCVYVCFSVCIRTRVCVCVMCVSEGVSLCEWRVVEAQDLSYCCSGTNSLKHTHTHMLTTKHSHVSSNIYLLQTCAVYWRAGARCGG